FDQFVEEAADLATVARDFRGAFFLFVEVRLYGHRDEDVMFLETGGGGRVMQPDVGIESVDALASGHAEVSSLVGGKRWRTKAMESGRSAGGNGVEHGPGMAGHFHATPFGRQLAVRVDQEGAAHDAHEALAVQDLLVDHVERAAPGFVGIGHEREGQFLLRGEVGVRLLRIARHADDLRVALAEGGVQIAKILRFAGAAGGRVLRVEVHHQPLALEVGQLQFIAVAGGAFQRVQLLADFEHDESCTAVRRRASRLKVGWRDMDGGVAARRANCPGVPENAGMNRLAACNATSLRQGHGHRLARAGQQMTGLVRATGSRDARRTAGSQNFTGSMIASRFRPSHNSRKSSRSAAMWISAGMPMVNWAWNISAPVCMAW